MAMQKIRAAALTVSDRFFFPGTLATVNSLLHFHPDLPVHVIDNGLTDPQRQLLVDGGVIVSAADVYSTGGRHIGPWELKAYAAAALAPDYDVLIGIDSDCIICSSLDDMICRAFQSRKWLGGQDGSGIEYDASYSPYGIDVGSRNPKYMSTSLYFCPISPESLAILDRWAECCASAVFNGHGCYPGHGDQGVLNAILYHEACGDAVELLPNSLWSQHWEYWQTVVSFDGGQFVNRADSARPQRAFHCGGAEKFWSAEHSRRVISTNPSQTPAYAWFLAMLWFGRCRNWGIDPLQYLPEPSWHLIADLVNFFHTIAAVYPRAREIWPPGERILERLVDGVRRAMSFGSSLSEYIALARALPDGAKLVEVGSCEGGSIVPVAISVLDRDVICYAVESFTGDLNGTIDGWPLPDPSRFAANVCHRYPHLRLVSVPGRSTQVASLFADASLDLVFIDASHDTPSVQADIDAWTPKLKPGGLLAGDDWGWPSVRAAVQSRFASVESTPSGAVWRVQL